MITYVISDIPDIYMRRPAWQSKLNYRFRQLIPLQAALLPALIITCSMSAIFYFLCLFLISLPFPSLPRNLRPFFLFSLAPSLFLPFSHYLFIGLISAVSSLPASFWVMSRILNSHLRAILPFIFNPVSHFSDPFLSLHLLFPPLSIPSFLYFLSSMNP